MPITWKTRRNGQTLRKVQSPTTESGGEKNKTEKMNRSITNSKTEIVI